MTMREIALALIVIFSSVGLARADEVELTPNVVVVIPDSTGANSTVLLRFALPTELAESEISSADLSLGVLCEDGQAILAWAHPISTDWQNPPSPQWLISGDAYSVKEASTCEMEDCGDRIAHFEVGKWVRGWTNGTMLNFGLLLHPAAIQLGAFKVSATGESSVPVLRVIRREEPDRGCREGDL